MYSQEAFQATRSLKCRNSYQTVKQVCRIDCRHALLKLLYRQTIILAIAAFSSSSPQTAREQSFVQPSSADSRKRCTLQTATTVPRTNSQTDRQKDLLVISALNGKDALGAEEVHSLL